MRLACPASLSFLQCAALSILFKAHAHPSAQTAFSFHLPLRHTNNKRLQFGKTPALTLYC